MTWRLSLLLALGAVLLLQHGAQAQELLTNGGLELTPPDDGGATAVAPGWVTEDSPVVPALPGPYTADYSNGGVTLPCTVNGCGAVDAADWVIWRKTLGTAFQLFNEGTGISTGNVTQSDKVYWRQRFNNPIALSLSEPSNFSHLIFEGDWQHWFQPYNGTFASAEDNESHLMQTVPGTPGLEYTMKGWALFEAHFAGGVANLNMDDGDTDFQDGPLSPTDALFGLDFLDSGGNVLAGSVEIDLMADGQTNNTMWKEHTLVGTAPAGTTQVRVRATMLDGVLNPGADPQSFLVDLFSLTAAPGAGGGAGVVPEPAAWLLLATALGGLVEATRRRRRAPFLSI